MKGENIVVGIFGWKGSSKTTTLTLFLLLEHISNPQRKTFSNYKLEFDFEWLNGRDMIDLTEKLQDSIVGIDELHEYADSRNSGTLQNKRVSDFFFIAGVSMLLSFLAALFPARRAAKVNQIEAIKWE